MALQKTTQKTGYGPTARRDTERQADIVQADIMAKTNPLEFLQQVRSEVGKVTWPTRRETGITTAMVLVMAVASALFFMIVDWLIRVGLSLLLSLGS